ncbi:MAG: peptide ABC transporter substrate-binding protein, partial [Simkaniaceae bacterium]|nr:peptide ABC transporter substrate-binding protein [Simkaniaceae bacterium]
GNIPASMLGIKAIDNQTLLVKLENPTPYFLELAASPPFFPVNMETDKVNPNWATKSETFVSSGPFTPSKWEIGNELTATRNENYWDANAVKLSNVKMVMVNSETALNMFENNELDWEGSPLSALPPTALETLRKANNVHTEPSLGTYLIRINTANATMQNPKVRKALSYAINRQAIIDHVIQGEQAAATRFVPETMNLCKEGYFTDNNAELARTLFDEAVESGDVSRSDFYNITLTHVIGERSQKVCEAIQGQWREILGIEVRLQSVEPKVYYSQVNRQDYQLALGSWIADFSDAISFLEVFKTKNNGTNNTNWENADYVAKLTASDTCKDPVQRENLLKEGETILMNDMPIIPLYHYNMLYVKKDNIKDVVLSNMGSIDLKWAYVD